MFSLSLVPIYCKLFVVISGLLFVIVGTANICKNTMHIFSVSIYRVYKKGNCTFECSRAFTILQRERVLLPFERPGSYLLNATDIVKFEAKLTKYKSDKHSDCCNHIFYFW